MQQFGLYINRLKKQHPAFIEFFKHHEKTYEKKKRQSYLVDDKIHAVGELVRDLKYAIDMKQPIEKSLINKLVKAHDVSIKEFIELSLLDELESSFVWKLLCTLSQE